MSDRPGNRGFAAFAPADVDDAKRGRPDFDLSGYAQERGLEFHPAMTHFGAFGQAMPQPFEAELAPRREGTIGIPPEPQWQNSFTSFAERNNLVHEDPLEYHRAFPKVDHPGQAVAVMRAQALADARALYA